MSNGVWSNNFLSDIPTIGLARDSVDPEQVERPRRWDMRFIGRFMIAFGAISSVFDLLTFGILLFALRSTAPGYVLATELAKRPFYRAVSGEAELASVHQASVPHAESPQGVRSRGSRSADIAEIPGCARRNPRF